MKDKLITFMVALMLSFFCSTAHASIIYDFSWVSGPTTLANTLLSDGTSVSISSTPLTTIGGNGNSMIGWQDETSRNTQITLSFDRSLDFLRLHVNDLDGGYGSPESLANFSFLPTSVSSSFSLSGATVRGRAQNVSGDLIWSNANISEVSFVFTRGANSWLGMNEFEISEIAPVPEPASILLLGAGIAGLAVTMLKKERWNSE